MSRLHNLADDDPIWDAVYEQDEFVGYDRSECGPLLRVVAAELRNLTALRLFRDVQHLLLARANELDGGAS